MEDASVSISKGVFVLKNEKISDFKNSKKKEGGKTSTFSNQLWYQSYKNVWTLIEKKIANLNDEIFGGLLKNLVEAVKCSYNEPVTEIPTKILLTGINMPDHSALFSTLCKDLKKSVTPYIAVLHTEDCLNLKNLVENTVNQFVNKTGSNKVVENELDDSKSKIRKTYCSFALLQAWYESLNKNVQQKTLSQRKTRREAQPLIILIPDFESFKDKYLQEFILIISSYLNILPIILIFGIATSINAIHKSLPFRVSSKLNLQVFNSQPTHLFLDNIIENVLLTENCPFHVGGKVFDCFTEIFLYYDLSVKRFIQNFKYAMLEHYSNSRIMALCTTPRNIGGIIEQLNDYDLQAVRNLPSFKDHYKTKKGSGNFKDTLLADIQVYYSYLSAFHLFLKCFHVLVANLPNAPLGKQVRQLYCIAASEDITRNQKYVESFKLIGFHSKEDLTEKVKKMCDILERHVENYKFNKTEVNGIFEELQTYLEEIEAATTEVMEEAKVASENTEKILSNQTDRKQLRKKLLELTKTSKPISKYEKIRVNLIRYLESVFEKYLKPPTATPFYDIFFFDDLSIKQVILGSHRSAIHTALNDPHHYLRCECCKVPDNSTILATMPDISILYKLHLEYGKLINLHDWLRSFISIVDPGDNAEEEESDEEDEIKKISPELYARFTQGVADLEFLGFVKNYKRKTDHVVRLTWGG